MTTEDYSHFWTYEQRKAHRDAAETAEKVARCSPLHDETSVYGAADSSIGDDPLGCPRGLIAAFAFEITVVVFVLAALALFAFIGGMWAVQAQGGKP